MTTEPLDLDAVAGAARAGGDSTPVDGVPADGTPVDGVPADGTPVDSVPADSAEAQGNPPPESRPFDRPPSESPPGDTLLADTVIYYVHIEVTSLAGFKEFCVGPPGFEVRGEMTGASFVAAGGYHHHVGANLWNRKRESAEGPGLACFGVVLSGSAALAAVRKGLERRGRSVVEDGIGFERAVHGDGFAVTDPDGIELRIRAGSSEIG
ncbi:MAG: hypothetical protein V5A43_06035 [Haloarculaceae archaeon]